jgi:hypothetical protein
VVAWGKTGLFSPWRSTKVSKKKNVWEEGGVLDNAVGQAANGPVADTAEPNGAPKLAESKFDKWKRLVNARFPKARRALERLESLGVRSQYGYTPEQVDRLLEALRVLVANVEKSHTKGNTATPAVLFE